MLLFGCTNWKKKYTALNVMHQNTLGLLDCEKAKNNQLTNKVTRGRLTIEEMQRQVTKGSWFRNISAAEVAGFEKGCNVIFDHSAATITITLANTILFNQEEAVLLMLEKYEVVSQMFNGFDYKKYFILQWKITSWIL